MTPALQKFLDDLADLGFTPELICTQPGQYFAVLRDYSIEVGRFAGRVIDLGLPAILDYPRMVGQSINVKSCPHLLENGDTLPGIRNIVGSPLGDDWRYWSYRFIAHPDETAKQLMIQVNGVFKRV